LVYSTWTFVLHIEQRVRENQKGVWVVGVMWMGGGCLYERVPV
jgi:hypothetical protein